MAIGTVQKYDGFEYALGHSGNRAWDDATTGNIIWCLADETYTPSDAHSTTNDVSTALITTGDGVPINATGLAIDKTTTAGTTYYDSDDANFGSSVTITAKYLIAVQPVTAGTFSGTTDVLLFYVDLDTTSGSSTVSSAPDFIILAPTNGWLSSAQA